MKNNNEKSNKKNMRMMMDIAYFVVLGLIFVTFAFGVSHDVVSGHSMDNTLHDGQRLMSTQFNNFVEKGDIVIATPEAMDGKRVIKRVIAMDGDTVSFHDGVTKVNGVVLEEDYVSGNEEAVLDGEIVIPDGHVWIMGDNRNNSIDSRYIGPVAMDDIEGEVILSIIPFKIIK